SMGGDSAGEESGGEAGASCSSSFTAGTPVHTKDGIKPIEEVELNDLVFAYDEETGKLGYHEVTAEFRRSAPATIVVTAGEENIETTGKHPFFVEGKGWVEAKDLKEGNLLQTNAKTVEITRLEFKEQKTTVYNIEIDQAHNYYVSTIGAWVHNPRCLLSELPAPRTFSKAKATEWAKKMKAFAKSFGDHDVRYTDPKTGRRLIDFETYKRGMVSLRGVSSSDRNIHFRLGDSSMKINDPNFLRGDFTWHHSPYKKEMYLVDSKLHAGIGHQGGIVKWW
ncbi:MAG: polymorphic toxin-type HINT domain-containing protein, partial [Leptospirales bacterium]